MAEQASTLTDSAAPIGDGLRQEAPPVVRVLRFARAYYFLFFMALSVISPYLVLHYRSRGLSATQIGLILGAAPIVRVLCTPLWGSLADLLHRQREVFLVALAGMIVTLAGIWRAPIFALLLPAVLINALFGAPVQSLADASVMTLLGPRRDQYGKQRLWGTIGWGIGGPLAGLLAERAGLDWNFGVAIALYALGFVVVMRLPIAPAPRSVPFWRGLRLLATEPWWIPFVATAFAISVGESMLGGLLFLHLANLEVPESVMGLSLAFIMVGELPVLFYNDLLLRRLGARGLLLASIAAGAVMLLAVSWMRAGWVVLLIQLLHGLAFTGKLTAILNYVSMTAPKGMQATAQTLFSALSAGLGAAVGGAAGGALFDAVGSAATFRLFGLTTIAAGIVFAFITRGRAAPASG